MEYALNNIFYTEFLGILLFVGLFFCSFCFILLLLGKNSLKKEQTQIVKNLESEITTLKNKLKEKECTINPEKFIEKINDTLLLKGTLSKYNIFAVDKSDKKILLETHAESFVWSWYDGGTLHFKCIESVIDAYKESMKDPFFIFGKGNVLISSQNIKRIEYKKL